MHLLGSVLVLSQIFLDMLEIFCIKVCDRFVSLPPSFCSKLLEGLGGKLWWQTDMQNFLA